MNLRAKQAISVTIGVIVAGVMLLLGLWQMSSFQRSMVDVAAERAAEPSLSLADSVSSDGTIQDIYGRRVQFSGQIVPGRELYVGTHWPLRVAVPFEMTDGRVVPLVLGLADAPVVLPNPGQMDVEGIFTAGDRAEDVPAPGDAPKGSVPSLRLQELVQEWPQPMVAGYVTLNAEQAAGFGLEAAKAELPEVHGTAMHQGYALQWWVFAGAAVAFSIVVARGFKPPVEKTAQPIS